MGCQTISFKYISFNMIHWLTKVHNFKWIIKTGHFKTMICLWIRTLCFKDYDAIDYVFLKDINILDFLKQTLSLSKSQSWFQREFLGNSYDNRIRMSPESKRCFKPWGYFDCEGCVMKHGYFSVSVSDTHIRTHPPCSSKQLLWLLIMTSASCWNVCSSPPAFWCSSRS